MNPFGRPHGRHGGPHRGGWSGRGADRGGFEHGRLRFVLLGLIAEKPRHGYELIKAIEERTGGAYSPSPGAVYPTLTLLQEQGHITLDDSDGQRRLCQITEAGRRYLAENAGVIAELEARMSRPGRGPGGGRGPVPAPIVRAMENLHTALRLRLAGAELDRDQALAIAARLDAAATDIERS